MKTFTTLLIAIFLLIFSIKGFAQKPGTPDYLLVKNGFKIFKLGESIDKYRPYVRLVSDGESKKYEVTDSNLLSVGNDIKLKKIVLYTKDDLITDIYVELDRQYNEQFLATLIAAYGMGEEPNALVQAYLWRTSNKEKELIYFDKSRKDNSLAIFSFVNEE